MNIKNDQTDSSYPQFFFSPILIEDNYKAAIASLPNEPVPPVLKLIKDERKGFFSFSMILAIIIFFISLNSPSFFGTGMVFIAVLLIYKFVLSSSQSADYYNALQREKEVYSSALAKHQEDTQSFIPILQLKQAVPKYMEEDNDMAKVLIMRDLYRLKNIVISDDSAIKTGYSENSFYPFLKLQFGERIKTKKKVSSSSTFDSYFPDFVYIDNVRQIYLEIEIDEPYDLQTGKPIHCHFDDSIRNNFFVENYWSVIRFSEKQVVSEPENCIKTIQSFITALENGHANWISYNTEDSTWDMEAAIKMEEGGYREAYLGIEKQVRIIPIESPLIKKNRLDIDELMLISPRFDFRPRSSESDDDLPF